MVDRVYRTAIPAFRKALTELREEFSALEPRTDWNRLRVEPLLAHVRALEERLRSDRFAGEVTRLRRGVPMFHADLVYLRENLKILRELLREERRPPRSGRPGAGAHRPAPSFSGPK